MRKLGISLSVISAIAWIALPLSTVHARANNTASVHGLWVWKGPTVVSGAHGAALLRDFCRAQGVYEVYVSVSEAGQMMSPDQMAGMIGTLHRANIRVEALFSSENADEGGPHLEKLLDRVRTIVQFNRSHGAQRFDGIHLDIEPQQRPENKGPGNLRFLPGLVDAYLAVRSISEPARLTVNADIQNKILKGTVDQRRQLFGSVPRVTLMMYEVSTANDGDSVAQKAEKAEAASKKFLEMAYDGLGDEPHLAKMNIGLRTPDYGAELPQMLQALDDANRANPHYLGWARHSYNDTLVSSAH
jgi:hypothetical protein